MTVLRHIGIQDREIYGHRNKTGELLREHLTRRFCFGFDRSAFGFDGSALSPQLISLFHQLDLTSLSLGPSLSPSFSPSLVPLFHQLGSQFFSLFHQLDFTGLSLSPSLSSCFKNAIGLKLLYVLLQSLCPSRHVRSHSETASLVEIDLGASTSYPATFDSTTTSASRQAWTGFRRVRAWFQHAQAWSESHGRSQGGD